DQPAHRFHLAPRARRTEGAGEEGALFDVRALVEEQLHSLQVTVHRRGGKGLGQLSGPLRPQELNDLGHARRGFLVARHRGNVEATERGGKTPKFWAYDQLHTPSCAPPVRLDARAARPIVWSYDQIASGHDRPAR